VGLYTRFRALWQDGSAGGTPITAAALNHIEDGLVAASDHGQLAGLGDDDHPQYLLRTDASAAYAPRLARVARAHATAAQSIPNNTLTVIALAGETIDSDGLHDTATNNSRVVLNKIGRWLVTAQVSWAANTTGSRRAVILRNGVEHTASQIGTGPSVVTTTATSVVDATAVTDYVEAAGLQDSGAGLNTFAANPAWTFLSVVYLGGV
jgi:hypothetical protein